LDNVITKFAQDALRTICVAFKDIQEGENGAKHDEGHPIKDIETSGFTLICIFGIMDIIRAEVPQAVADVQRAGVTVRMVTGDNIVTAQAIAERCKIITKDEIGNSKVAMEGKEFFTLTGGLMCKACGKDLPVDCQCEQKDRIEVVKNAKAFKDLVPTFKVMARARPEDKYLLVTGLRNLNCTVAVTGDGTNDAPALKKADVGFAMGITGTDVA
jgi:Ca2+ transporting ATPase